MDLGHFEKYVKAAKSLPKNATEEETIASNRFNQLADDLNDVKVKVCKETVKIAMICNAAYLWQAEAARKMSASGDIKFPLQRRSLQILFEYATKASKMGRQMKDADNNYRWALERKDTDAAMGWESFIMPKYINVVDYAMACMINTHDTEGHAIFKQEWQMVRYDYKEDKIIGDGKSHARYFGETKPEAPKRKSDTVRDRTDSRFSPKNESDHLRRYDVRKDNMRGREHLS